MRRFYIFTVLIIAAVKLQAQIPSGYYNSASGKTGDELKAALHDIIDEHTTISYSQIWNAFKNTDTKGNNVVWDMYSDGANYTYYYNRKHELRDIIISCASKRDTNSHCINTRSNS